MSFAAGRDKVTGRRRAHREGIDLAVNLSQFVTYKIDLFAQYFHIVRGCGFGRHHPVFEFGQARLCQAALRLNESIFEREKCITFFNQDARIS